MLRRLLIRNTRCYRGKGRAWLVMSFWLFSIPLIPDIVPAQEREWEIESVDGLKDIRAISDRALRLDTNGYPRMAYGGDHLYYAWFDGARWNHETVDQSDAVGRFPSLALDSEGHPHISYYDDLTDDLKYACWDGSSWLVETVDAEGIVGAYASLALDSGGHPHISYYDNSNADLKHAYWDGSSWLMETVDAEGIVGEHTSLALDSGGHPHISYFDNSNADLKYAYWGGSAWHLEVADAEENAGRYTSLTLDVAGRPHISYVAQVPEFVLKYARKDTSGWYTETVDRQSIGLDTSIVLDELGFAHIGYTEECRFLRYVHWDGVTWRGERVDASGG